MGKIIRRTISITIRESWTIVWTEEPVDNLPTTVSQSEFTYLSQKEQMNATHEFEDCTETDATQPAAPAEASNRSNDDNNGNDGAHEPGRLPARSPRQRRRRQ